MRYILGVITLSGISLLGALGLVVLTGFTGLFSVGHAGFMAIGGYLAAVLVMRLSVPFELAVILGGLAAALISLAIGYPSLRGRMRGDYFAITMLGFGEAIRLLLDNTKPIIGGSMGLSGIPQLTTFWHVLVFNIIALIAIRNFVNSQWGKNCVAIREQEVAALLMGVNTARTKIWSLAISAFFVGCSGGLWAFYITYLQPSQFSQTRSSDLLAAVVFGGLHSITGPSLAALFLGVIPEVLREIAKYRLMAYGLLFVVMMVIRPQGLLGHWDISIDRIKALMVRLTGKRRGGKTDVSS